MRQLAAAVLLVVVAAGCGNGSDDDSHDRTGPDADEPRTTLERDADDAGTTIERETDLTTHEFTVDDDGFAGTSRPRCDGSASDRRSTLTTSSCGERHGAARRRCSWGPPTGTSSTASSPRCPPTS